MKFLIAGLGNIGAEYELTRHNIGFLVVDHLAQRFNADFKHNRLAFTSEFKFKGRSFTLVKPTTYMNLSGKAINYWLNSQKIPLENLLVISDDISLPFGKLRLRAKGSSAGHNGLKNIEEVLDGKNYARLKFGIGDNFSRGRQVDYVLERFTTSEFSEIEIYIEKAADMILSFGTVGIVNTMNQYND